MPVLTVNWHERLRAGQPNHSLQFLLCGVTPNMHVLVSAADGHHVYAATEEIVHGLVDGGLVARDWTR